MHPFNETCLPIQIPAKISSSSSSSLTSTTNWKPEISPSLLSLMARILASLPGNLFSPSPKNPRISEPNASKPPPIPITKHPKPSKPPKPSQKPIDKPKNPAFKSVHYRTKYYKPVSKGVVSSEGDRSVVIGESGVSYLLPGAPFEFQFSYSETPKLKPLAIREPAFLPFAPPSMSRPWTGKAPLKKSKKNIPLFDSFNPPPAGMKGVKHVEMPGPHQLGKFPKEGKTREEILGEPLSRAEVGMLIKPHMSHNRQVNLGRDGLTHNMLELIHSHWKRQRVCKVRCLGVPTVDMDNVCYHIEEKTGGKIIHRAGGVIYLFRGRNYNYRTRPQYPLMLWKPATPVYPKLIQEVPEGLKKCEADDLRWKGKRLLPICKLAKNGIYINLVKDVKNAFEGSPLVKVDCRGLEPSDYKKIGAKLKELVPCVLLSFDDEQILMWRGRGWKPMYPGSPSSNSSNYPSKKSIPSALDGLGDSKVKDTPSSNAVLSQSSDAEQIIGKLGAGIKSKVINMEEISPRIVSLWERAIESSKALLLDEVGLEPDSLLEKVEAFECEVQVTEHSYPALVLSKEDTDANLKTDQKDGTDFETHYDENNEDDFSFDGDDDYSSHFLEDSRSSLPPGSLPVDSITGLGGE